MESDDDQRKCDDDQRERSRDVRRVYLGLVLIAVGALLLLALLWGSTKDTLEYELAKGCIGVLTVALVGFVVSMAVYTVQRERTRRDKEFERASAKKERDAQDRREQFQRRLEQLREEWRREVERLRDERERKDALLRSLLEETLANYHDAKRARRLLKARVWLQDDGDEIDLDVYDEHLATINDAQLNFELLMRTVGVLHDRPRIDERKLHDCYSEVEEYLNKIVSEYEEHRRRVAHAVGKVSIRDLPALRGFLEESHTFKSGASTPIESAIKDFRKALCEQLHIPIPQIETSSRLVGGE
jgi:hypothetical protein